MSHYKQYPYYKESGVNWLGDIPKQWRVVPLKALAKGEGTIFIDGDWIESPNLTDSGIRYITTGNVGEGVYKEQGSGYISSDTFVALNCTEVFPGDLLISRLNPPIGRCCIVPNLGSRIVTSVDNVIVRLSAEHDKRFLMYRLSAGDYFHETSLLASGATMQRISRTELGNVRIAVPSLHEQERIADILDSETARLDALIAKKTRFIELLKEKRQALITNAVTSGLSHGAPTRNSGIEWLGEIPLHWEVKRVRFLASKIGSGKTPSGGRNTYVESGVMFLRSQNVYDDGLRLEEVAFISKATHEEMSNSEVKPNDILLNITGASIGRASIVPIKFGTANVNQHVCIIRCTKSDVADWLHLSLCSHSAKKQIEVLQSGAGREGLNFEQVGDLVVALSPESERQLILQQLTKLLGQVNSVIGLTQRSIDLLKERRSAFITAAVTGQIDLRESA